jgi:SHS2 domain-containing protein
LQKPGFKRVEHFSDAGIEFYGDSPENLFENAGMGMFSIMTDIENVAGGDTVKINISIDYNSLEDLLILWLEKLIYHFETGSMLFSGFKVNAINRFGKGYKLDGEIMGEIFDSKKHKVKIGIKAPTYHQLGLKKIGQKWWGRVIFDI